jgi:TolB-like protein/DNA-binding winged helix-turn-helix (wHTH) protein/Tfp pilus assembly protein PilF
MTGKRSDTYQLDLIRYELRRGDDVKVKIERLPMDLLIFLVERKGQLVTREDVAARLWRDGAFVDTEPAINNVIRKIRTALHDSPDQPAHLETVVGKGYRYIGDLRVIGSGPRQQVPEPAPPTAAGTQLRWFRRGWFRPALAGTAFLLAAGALAWRAPWRPAAASIRSLAVLPLQNLSGDPAQKYFADGFTEELTTNLAKIGSLRVVSRTSTMQYVEPRTLISRIARELNVDAVVEGSVLRSGNRVRITAQLIDARTDAHLWAQSYERDLGEILELQDSVTGDIATQVKASLSPEASAAFASHPRVNPEAYEAYLRGRNEIGRQTPDSIRNSVQHFQRAIDLDPLYATAYAGLADSFSLMANYSVLPPKEVFPRAEAAARKALELDPGSPEAHASLAFARHHFDWDWTGAEKGYKRAIQLSPSFPIVHLRYAVYLSNAGRHDEAIREIGLARQLDPLSLTVANNVGMVLFYARRYDEAIREVQSIIALNPDRIWPHMTLGFAYTQKRMYPLAIAESERADQLLGTGPGVDLAQAYASSGQTEAARRALRELEKPDAAGLLDWFFIAGVYTALGDREQAFAWLEQAYQNRDFFLTYLNVYPFLDALHSDPRFVRLQQRVGVSRGPSP